VEEGGEGRRFIVGNKTIKDGVARESSLETVVVWDSRF
jgi:hypothetical protein